MDFQCNFRTAHDTAHNIFKTKIYRKIKYIENENFVYVLHAHKNVQPHECNIRASIFFLILIDLYTIQRLLFQMFP